MVQDRTGNWVFPGENGTAPASTGTGGYNLAPSPTGYNPAYGGVPGVVGQPPSLYKGIQSIYPGISGLTSGAGNVISSQLAGELSPQTINAIQDQAAAFGISSGLPLTNFAGMKGLKQLGLNVENVQNQGAQNYNAFLAGLGGTADNPNLAAELAMWNATNLAAGIPEAVAKAAQDAYNKAMLNAQGAGSPKISPGSGTIMPNLGGGSNPARGTTPGAYEYTPQVYKATGPFGLPENPLTTSQNWDKWAASLPATAFTPQSTYDPFGRATENTPAFLPGDFSGINVGDYTGAGGTGTDWGAIYNEAGLPYFDWNNYVDPTTGNAFDWGIYE